MLPIRIRIGMFALSAILLAAGNPVRGEDQESEEEKSAEEEKTAIQSDYQEEVVVTATRLETPLLEVGSSVTVITSDEMRRRQIRFVLDALRDVPGVGIRRSGGPGTATSIFTRGTDSDQTLLMIDGVKIHDPSSPAAAAVLNNLLVDDVDRIEVVRGPQSTLYGSQAIGGVINIITKKGKGKPVYSASVEGGSFGTWNGTFQSSGGTDKVDYSFSATRIDTDSFSARAGGSAALEDDPYTNSSFSGRFGVRASDTFRLDVMVRYLDADLEVDAGSDPANARELTEQTVFQIRPHWFAFDGRWEQKLALSSFEIERDNRFAFPSRFEGTILAADWQNNLHLNDDNTLTVGLAWENQDAVGQVTGFSGYDADTDNLALYVQDLWNWKEKFSSTIGFRVDDHEIFGSHFTYRAAATYDFLRSGTRLLGSVGTGFKAPSLSELFDASFGSSNPDLKPEESLGADLGVNQVLAGGKASVGMTFFYNAIDNMIVAVFNGVGFPNINIEEVETKGVETFFEFLPKGNWSSRVTYTYTDTEATQAASFLLTNGSQLLRRPEHEAGAHLSYGFPKDRGQTTLSVIYVGEREDISPVFPFSTVTADSYGVANLAGSVQVGNAVEIFARIDNLFDEEYQEVLGFNSPDRSAFAGLKWSF